MKSYFNVPDNINSSNRHLGTEKNTRGRRPENRAKKQHRIKKLKYEKSPIHFVLEFYIYESSRAKIS